jgi:hypothetical protein
MRISSHQINLQEVNHRLELREDRLPWACYDLRHYDGSTTASQPSASIHDDDSLTSSVAHGNVTPIERPHTRTVQDSGGGKPFFVAENGGSANASPPRQRLSRELKALGLLATAERDPGIQGTYGFENRRKREENTESSQPIALRLPSRSQNTMHRLQRPSLSSTCKPNPHASTPMSRRHGIQKAVRKTCGMDKKIG